MRPPQPLAVPPGSSRLVKYRMEEARARLRRGRSGNGTRLRERSVCAPPSLHSLLTPPAERESQPHVSNYLESAPCHVDGRAAVVVPSEIGIVGGPSGSGAHGGNPA